MKRKWVIGVAVVVIVLVAAHLLIRNMDPAGFMRELHGM
jgi:hypothetical protein